jgi:hypothetical protein
MICCKNAGKKCKKEVFLCNLVADFCILAVFAFPNIDKSYNYKIIGGIMKIINLSLILFFVLIFPSYGQTVLIRPNASIGYLSSDDANGLAVNYGIKVHLPANEFQRYGILVDHLFVPNNKDFSYLRAGLMLEQVVFKYFNMGIGTIGYINLVEKGEYPFGIYSHLGFEYKFLEYFHILVSYQSDFIFRKNFTMFNAFMFGAGIQF